MALIDAVSKGVVGVLGRAPKAAQSALGGRHVNADGDVLEPEVAAALRLLALMPDSDFSDLPLETARRQIDAEADLFGGKQLPMSLTQDVSIPTPEGSITGRLYVGPNGPSNRLLLYFHGGGWVLGSLESHDSPCRFLATHAGVNVLAVDYRLAPEHPFPAAPSDALAAFEYAVAMAPEWGHDPTMIGVAGDSAGGNLSAVLAIDLRDAPVRPAMQVLFFPVTDLSAKTASYSEFSEGYFLTEKQMDWYSAHYCGDTDPADPRISPLLAKDLTGLAPAYVVVSGFDPLRDEGEAYAKRLAEAGVQVALRRHGNMIHAFVNSTGVGRASREAMLEACGAIRMGLGVGL